MGQQLKGATAHVEAALTVRLRAITRGAIGKGRTCMRLSREVALHSSDFDLEPFLSLVLCYPADAHADANPEISLIDESPAVSENGDAWCACRGHELLLLGGGVFSDGQRRAKWCQKTSASDAACLGQIARTSCFIAGSNGLLNVAGHCASITAVVGNRRGYIEVPVPRYSARSPRGNPRCSRFD